MNSRTDELLTDDHEISDEKESPAMTDEDWRLGGRPPLKTILILSAGPLISQITGALYGVVNSVWISKAIGDAGLTAISSYQNFDTIGRSFACFLQVAAAAKISSLFGEGRSDEAAQVFSDLLRISVICAILAPAICIPASKPCVKWFGAMDDIADLGYQYIIPNLCLTIVPCIFLVGCGSLQAEGRSWLFSIAQVCALVLNMAVFCPLFLLGFKTGISGAAYATGLAEFIPGIIIAILFYKGKFGIKPKPRELLNKLSPHTYEAIKIGMAQFILQLSWAIPGIIIRKLFGMACNAEPVVFNNVMAGYNAFNRFWAIEGAIPNAVTIGFIPAASYAYGAKRFKRVFRLLIHATWTCVLWCSATMILTLGFPRALASIFSKTPEYLYWSEIVIRNGNYATFCIEVPGVITALLQATGYGNMATILNIVVQLIPVPVVATILYYTDPTNIPRLILCYPIQSVFGVIVSIPFAYFVLKKIFKEKKDKTERRHSKLETITDDKHIGESIKTDENGIPIEEFIDEGVKSISEL